MRRDLRLVPLAVGSWVVAYAAICLPAAALPIAVALWVGAGACTIACLRAPRGGGTLALLAVGIVLAAVSSSHVALAQADRGVVRSLELRGGRAVADHLDALQRQG